MTAILALLGPKVLAIGAAAVAALLALIGIRWQARREGAAQARQEQEKMDANAIREGVAERDRVRAAGPDAARDELHRKYDQPRH